MKFIRVQTKWDTPNAFAEFREFLGKYQLISIRVLKDTESFLIVLDCIVECKRFSFSNIKICHFSLCQIKEMNNYLSVPVATSDSPTLRRARLASGNTDQQ